MRRWYILLLLPATLAFWSPRMKHSAPAPNPDAIDSVGNADYVGRQIAYNGRYSFLSYDLNFLGWKDYAAVLPAFNALKTTPYNKVKIVHIGDSHVQADIVTGQIRNRLQDVFGDGGRGLIFPYSAARTHPGYDYYSSHGGNWHSARNIQQNPAVELGLSGVSILTRDSKAWVKILFNNFHRPVDNRILKIFCRQGVGSYDLRVEVNGEALPQTVSCRDSLLSYVQVRLPENPRSIALYVKKTAPEQHYFELHGMSLETEANSGVLYHSVGINGAGLGSVLRQNLMERQLRDIRPDLVIVDLGANDYFVGGLDESSYALNLEEVVSRIRRSAPNATVLLSCSQDIYRYARSSLKDCQKAAKLTQRVAFENRCAFYNYYDVAGGRFSMKKWRQYQLAKTDMVHLTFEGYRQKGDLYANALLGSYRHSLAGGGDKPFLPDTLAEPAALAEYRIDNPDAPAARRLDEKPVSRPATAAPPAEGQRKLYTIRPGDNLGRIAAIHGVSVSELMQWNGLRSSMIRAGDRIVVWARMGVDTAPPPAPAETKAAPKPPTTKADEKPAPAKAETKSEVKPSPKPESKPAPVKAAPKKSGGLHTVSSGESLWSIARKHETTVAAIKKANGMNSDKIRAGQKLKIPN